MATFGFFWVFRKIEDCFSIELKEKKYDTEKINILLNNNDATNLTNDIVKKIKQRHYLPHQYAIEVCLQDNSELAARYKKECLANRIHKRDLEIAIDTIKEQKASMSALRTSLSEVSPDEDADKCFFELAVLVKYAACFDLKNDKKNPADSDSAVDSIPVFDSNSEVLFKNIIDTHPQDLKIDIAFQCGSSYFTSASRKKMLHQLIAAGAQIRIIVNSGEMVSKTLMNKENPFVDYSRQWKEKAHLFEDHLQVKTLDFPLFHRTFIIHCDSSSFAYIGSYFYGETDENMKFLYASGTNEYLQIQKEFEYLWEKGLE